MDTIGKLGIVGAAVAVGAAVFSKSEAVKRLTSGPKAQGLILALCQKWGPVFGAPVPLLMTIADNESSFRPGVSNTNERAMKLGGAWGAMAMTLTTAKSVAAQLKTHTSPLVRQTLAKWDGTGKGLLDPDICIMFAAHELGRDFAEFKSWILAAAAYHQGRGKIREMVKAKQPIPAALPPFGKQYVTDAINKYPRYA